MTIILDEPAELYHANTAIGSSDIRAFIRSPLLFNDQRTGIYPKESPSMLFGTHSHMALLEPKRFASRVMTQPDVYQPEEGPDKGKDKPWHNSAKVCKKYHADMRAAGYSVITGDQKEALRLMAARMPAQVAAILRDSKAEVTFRTKIGALDVQCRIDALDGIQPYDLKTIKAIESIDQSIVRLGYHIQSRWYEMVMEAENGTKPAPMRFIFVENAPPFRWRLCDLDTDYREIARKAVDEALEELAECIRHDLWVDRDDLHHLASPPEWMSGDDFDDGEE